MVKIGSALLSAMTAGLLAGVLGIVVIFMVCLHENSKEPNIKTNNKYDSGKNANTKKENRKQINSKQKIDHEGITFDQVAGHTEVKKDLQDLIEFMKNPDRYTEMGARFPKGIIFYGPPGNGKTLIAKAVAGEAGVTFISASGSDFVEKYVGVGAKRVRDLFNKARKNAPCIVFIDELDAVGSQRDGDNSERNQTVNALLTELDGFDTEDGVLVIAATNRIDMLDQALIRTGRLDRHIAIPLPDYEDRVELIELYTTNKRIKDISIHNLASSTEGFSASDIENLLNESAILATNRNKTYITNSEINDAMFKILTKGNPKNHPISDLRIVAYHEAGHTVVAKLLNRAVSKVTCIGSTSGIGGLTLIPPKTSIITKEDLINEIKILYGGRIAEYLLSKDKNKVTIGASNDIQQATAIIEKIINEFGMGEGILRTKGTSTDATNEAKELSKKIYDETLELLETNSDKLERLAEKLVVKNTLTEAEIDKTIFSTFTKYA